MKEGVSSVGLRIVTKVHGIQKGLCPVSIQIDVSGGGLDNHMGLALYWRPVREVTGLVSVMVAIVKFYMGYIRFLVSAALSSTTTVVGQGNSLFVGVFLG